MLTSSQEKEKKKSRKKPRTNKQLKLLDQEDRFNRAPMLDEIYEAQKIMKTQTINKDISNARTVGWGNKIARGNREEINEYQGNPMS